MHNLTHRTLHPASDHDGGRYSYFDVSNVPKYQVFQTTVPKI